MGTSDDSADASLLRDVLRTARQDPDLLPAEAARLTVARLGPRVARREPRAAGKTPAPTEEQRERLTERTCRAVAAEGAFVGGPVVVLVPVAFCAALLRQLRGVLELAALAGLDPAAEERAAELLLLQGAYADPGTARAAVAETRQPGVRSRRPVRGFGWAAWWALGLRAARLLGLLTQDQARSRWAQVGSWLFLGVVFLAGLVAPLVWLPYMAWSYDRATRRLLDQAAAFYLGVPEVTAEGEALERPTPQGRRRVDPALVGGLVRGLGSLLVGLALVAFTVLADLTLLGSRWPVLALLLAVSSGLTGVLWLWRHGGWRRRRR
ncbi:hypothetical protein [Streptacidiphilus monticola]|uniref:Uncharacterized protein n=1 Tax=Streptacidiphilus monticola TaxID=2161674 RepID=A0ABW1G1Q6_9ACTN